MPTEKSPIQQLSGEELEKLSKFKDSDVYEILKKLVEYEKYTIFRENFYAASEMEEVYVLRGRNRGLDFLMSSVHEAREELKARGAQVDSEE